MLNFKTGGILGCLGYYCRMNVPILILDEMSFAVDRIWMAGGRSNGVKLRADQITSADLSLYAADANCDGIFLRAVETLSSEEQIALSNLLVRLPTNLRGKFMFSASRVSEILCKLV